MNKRTVGTAVPQKDATHSGTTKFNPNGTISIKDTVQNPARALQYMIDGLERQDKRNDFVIDMGTYGDYYLGNCQGCAATCTIQEITKKDFTPENIGGRYALMRAKALNFDRKELGKFESAIDGCRRGNFYPLYSFFNSDNGHLNYQDYKDNILSKGKNHFLFKSYYNKSSRGDWENSLRDKTWKENLHYYKDIIKDMRNDNSNWE